MKIRLSNVLVIATVVLLGGAVSSGQSDGMFERDPAAAKEFKQLVSSYRNRPGLTVKTTMKLKLVEGELSSDTGEVQAEFTYSRGGSGIVKLRGFTCYFKDGQFAAIHEETDHSYYTEEYDETPYWTFLSIFRDIPFPHLGFLWGEPDMEDVYMQLYPQSDLIVPSSVEDVELKGKKLHFSMATIQNDEDATYNKIFVDISFMACWTKLSPAAAWLEYRVRKAKEHIQFFNKIAPDVALKRQNDCAYIRHTWKAWNAAWENIGAAKALAMENSRLPSATKELFATMKL